MLRVLKLWLRRLSTATPFDVRRRLPSASLDPLQLVLDRYEARGEKITVLQVGACDGVTSDPICDHVKKGSTRAILIEPNPYAFARLQENYRGIPNVTLVQSAIGETDGEARLYRVKQSHRLDDETDQIASFYRGHLLRHGKKADEIEEIVVPCRSLSSLVTELGLSKIDLLQIDTEGFDATVVRMALKMPTRPDCINFEHVHLLKADRKPLYDLLETNGYLLGYDSWNILAMRKPLMERTNGTHA